MRPIALAAALFVLVGCGGSPTPTAQSSPSAMSSSSSSPNASPKTSPSANPPPSGTGIPPPVMVSCTSQIPVGAKLALVALAKGTSPLVVRDITDIAHPITRCMISGASFHRFVDATHVSYIVTNPDGHGALYVTDLRDSSDTLIRSWTNEGSLYWVYAWSPDGKALTYLSSNGDKVAWHVLSAGTDVTLSDLGSIPGRGIDRNNDDVMVGFSADGKYVALENTFSNTTGAAPFQIVRLSDHKLVYSRTDGTMSVWAVTGATLYYRTSAGVESWDPTIGTRLVVPQGFRWIHPWPSVDATRIAYVDVDSKGNHFPGYVYLPTGQAIRVSSRPRTGAAYLTSGLIWYAEESVCSTPCGPKLTGRTFIFDVHAGTESVSIITQFFDSWPHTA